MTAMVGPKVDYRVGELRSIANSIEPAFPSAARELRRLADGLPGRDAEARIDELDEWLAKIHEGLFPGTGLSFVAPMERRRAELVAQAHGEVEQDREPTPAETVRDLLLLVEAELPKGRARPELPEIVRWRDEDREAVAHWAAAVHLVASDNDDVDIPLMPEVLR